MSDATPADESASQPDSTGGTEHSHIGQVLITEEQLQARVAELGAALTEEYRGRAPLLVGVLKGAFMFMSDLSRAIDLPVEFDFMAVSSYGSSTRSSGVVRIVKDLDLDLSGRDVILVEDIIDSGLTLSYLRRNLQARGPASLEVCSLLVRDTTNLDEIDVRHYGFIIPQKFVIGYGLDAAERFRNLPYIALYDGPVDG